MIKQYSYITSGGVRVEDWSDCVKIRHTNYLGDITILKEHLPEVIEALQTILEDEK